MAVEAGSIRIVNLDNFYIWMRIRVQIVSRLIAASKISYPLQFFWSRLFLTLTVLQIIASRLPLLTTIIAYYTRTDAVISKDAKHANSLICQPPKVTNILIRNVSASHIAPAVSYNKHPPECKDKLIQYFGSSLRCRMHYSTFASWTDVRLTYSWVFSLFTLLLKDARGSTCKFYRRIVLLLMALDDKRYPTRGVSTCRTK